MRKPFTFITIPIILGIVFCYYVKINIVIFYVFFLSVLILFVISIILNKFKNFDLIILFFCIGVIITHQKLNSSKLIKFKEKLVKAEGVIQEIEYKNDYKSCIVNINKIKYLKSSYFLKEKILLKIRGEKSLNIGDKIVFEGILNQPQRNKNPGLFNYRLYLKQEDIFVTSNINVYSISHVKKTRLPFYKKIKIKFQHKVENIFDKYLNKQNNSLMKSIVLGEYSFLNEKNLNRYRDLGLAHVMAVSGLHIGIISTFLIFVFSHLGINRKFNILITIFIIWIYGFLVGYPPSVLRCLIMFSVLYYSQIIYQKYNAVNTILFSMFIILFYNPLWLFNVGFQLSFAATFSIVLFTPKIRRKMYPFNKKIGTTLSTIIAVQLGVSPILIYHFNSVSLVSIISNFILIPLLSLSLILGFLLIILGCVSSIFSVIIAYMLNFLLKIQFVIVNSIYNFSIVKVNCYFSSVLGLVLCYVIILCMFKIINLKVFNFWIKKSIVFYLIFYIFCTVLFSNMNKTINIEFIDVGQGDCILIRSNNYTFLIDSGGNTFGDFDIGENIVLPYLKKQGIFKLDGIFISHFHDDHCKGFLSILDEIKIENIFIGYEDESNKLCMKILKEAEMSKIPVFILKKGDKILLNDKNYINILSPDENLLREQKDNENNLSLVLLLNCYDKKFLFTGDIEKETESYICNFNTICDIDVLKVPHHGSNTSSTDKFIDSFKPNFAIIQVGKNRFGHPNKETLDKYLERKIKIYRNDEHGLINIRIMPKFMDISYFYKETIGLDDIILNNVFDITFIIIFIILSVIISKKCLNLFKE